MRNPLLWVCVFAVAIAAGAWMLLTAPPQPDDPDPDAIEREYEVGDEEAGPAVTLEGNAPSQPRARPRRRPAAASQQDLPRGDVVVKVLDPDGAAVPSRDIRLVVEPVGRPFMSQPAAVPDPDGTTWRFNRVPVGAVRVRASGDHYVDGVASVEVKADAPAEVSLQLERAGSLTYKAALYNGDVPETVTLSLLDPTGKKLFPVWWQVRTETVLTEPRYGTVVTMGAEGIAYGIPPGKYRVKATSPGGDVDEHPVEVEAAKTGSVSFSFRE